jgi:hypothetical protein
MAAIPYQFNGGWLNSSFKRALPSGVILLPLKQTNNKLILTPASTKEGY